jgi:hypothetical protein
MTIEILIGAMAVVTNFGGVILANRVSLALIKRDVEALKEPDKDVVQGFSIALHNRNRLFRTIILFRAP